MHSIRSQLTQRHVGDIDHPIVFVVGSYIGKKTIIQPWSAKDGDGICAPKVQTLFVVCALENVHRPF